MAAAECVLGVTNEQLRRAHVLIPRASLNKSISTINAFIRPYIDSALRLQDSTKLVERSEPDYTFLHALAHYTRDPKLIRDQLVNILIAGRDTAASSLSWVFFELAKQPRVTTKLREEILAQVGFERPTYSQLKDMKYLQVSIGQGTTPPHQKLTTAPQERDP